MPSFTREIFDRLSAPGPRLDWLVTWLTGSVWSPERFKATPPVRYLEEGERVTNEIEEVIAASAPRVYDELTSVPAGRDVAQYLDAAASVGVVVFDGLSLREVPALLRLAVDAGFSVVENGITVAALPCETLDFIEQRLRCGRVAPSQLSSRRDLKDRGIAAYYYAHPGERHRPDADSRALLLWSSFPDNTYRDSGARFADHFAQICVSACNIDPLRGGSASKIDPSPVSVMRFPRFGTTGGGDADGGDDRSDTARVFCSGEDDQGDRPGPAGLAEYGAQGIAVGADVLRV